MIRFSALLVLCPLIAWADPVTIRSGEHETFTRLVLSIQTGTDWSVARSEQGFRLTLQGEGDGFDIAEVFDRVPRTRLLNLTQTSSEALDLMVDCECHVDAFLWRSDRLVVDVVDGPDPNGPTDDLTTAPIVARPAGQVPFRLAQGLPDLLQLENGLTLTDRVQPAQTYERPPVPRDEPAVSNATVTETALLDGIARAASQGFLDPNVTALTPETEAPDDVVIAENAPVVPADDPTPLNVSQLGVGITTALDRNLSDVADAIGALSQPQCLELEVFDLASWGDERAFHEQVASLSEALAGEFGEEPLEAQTDLAQLYLHFGFGAEALVVLAADQAASQSRVVLSELAYLIDQYDVPLPIITSQHGCATAGAMWAMLADPRPPADDDSRNAIIQTFFSLPQPLRSHIAPRLSDAFLTVDLPDPAQKIMRGSETIDVADSHEAQVMRAQIAEHLDDAEEALSVLTEQARTNARMSPASVIALIDLTLEQGLTPPEADLLLASALAVEFRGTPVAQSLATAEARGRTARGEHAEALKLLADRDDQQAVDVKESVYARIADLAPSAEFLEFAFDTLPPSLSDTTVNAFGRRLTELGFGERSLDLMATPASREAAAERRYLKAEAAQSLGDHVRVLEEVLGMSSDRARQLRAAAYTGLGEHRNALAALNQEDDASTPLLQFRAEAWERLTTEEDAALSDFARVRLEVAEETAATTLADRRALLERSQESRRAIEDLLQRFESNGDD